MLSSCGCCNRYLLCLSTSGSTGGGSERQSDVKDLPDLENLHLNDHGNKGSKTQVCQLVNVKAVWVNLPLLLITRDVYGHVPEKVFLGAII